MRFRSRITSRWIALVSIDSGRPSRNRAKWLSAAASSAVRVVAFSASRRRAIASRKHVEGKPHVVHHATMEFADFLQALGRERIAVLDLLRRQLHQVLV